MTRDEFKQAIGQGVVTVTRPDLIKAAWGNREELPEEVTANSGLWLDWFDEVNSTANGKPIKAKPESKEITQIGKVAEKIERKPKFTRGRYAGIRTPYRFRITDGGGWEIRFGASAFLVAKGSGWSRKIGRDTYRRLEREWLKGKSNGAFT
jgi:hypothetical protein